MGGSKKPMRIHLLGSEWQINSETDSSKLSQGRNDSQYGLGDIYWTDTTKTPRCFPKEGEDLVTCVNNVPVTNCSGVWVFLAQINVCLMAAL